MSLAACTAQQKTNLAADKTQASDRQNRHSESQADGTLIQDFFLSSLVDHLYVNIITYKMVANGMQ